MFVSKQDHISRSNTLDPLSANNSFAATDKHALTNIFLSWFLSGNLTLTLGAENLLDEDYIDHLTGFNRVLGSIVPQGSRMFGPGRNLFSRVQYRW